MIHSKRVVRVRRRSRTTLHKSKKDAKTLKDRVDSAQTAWTSIKACADNGATPADQKIIYSSVSLSDQTLRLSQLSGAVGAANQLADLLAKQYGASDKWMGPNATNYVVSDEITPSYQQMQNVTVKVASVAIKVDELTSRITTEQQSLGSVSFSIRKYSVLTPEVGIGAVFGTIKQPQYGTGKNAAGQTIITRVLDNSLSVNPTVLANFVCRCGTGLLVPMVQVGAAASKDLPAILLGAGLRLFGVGKGDVAIGGGAMFAWYKDLQKLHVGDVVNGTSDISADLGYINRPTIGGYFAIQYKF
jgi:hypothetical protein